MLKLFKLKTSPLAVHALRLQSSQLRRFPKIVFSNYPCTKHQGVEANTQSTSFCQTKRTSYPESRSTSNKLYTIYGQSRAVVIGEKILQGNEEVRNSSTRKEAEDSSTRKPDLQVHAQRIGKESS
ncbi:hypothetical protein GCK72_022997 [Caenorhabditis remanei]|uniref:Uncharacterized protein n=1 Tax=Caenorhabditis remanei TaxID=31234 RepID=A0A6A5FVU0_CAERE|nr:hypothetical protein GCK72_022997 [Caenorhabditis remanei]KAF1746541.1 hypothetical protein GCK72_022997 [Caenorhabditis remanei]